MDILIATKNAYKVGEMAFYLEDLEGIKIHFLKDQGFDIEIEENCKSLKENAGKKAIEISKKTNFLTLASDGGVTIPALGEKWDFLRSQRMVGEEKSDLEKSKTLLEMMKDLEGEERKIENYLALAVAKNGKLLWSDEKVTERGYVLEHLVDEDIPEYRWLGHLWYYREFGKVFNKLDAKELKQVREQAKELKENLQKFLRSL
jgi:inosine/xanthosine triphosphate pyrophosphatase family protein